MKGLLWEGTASRKHFSVTAAGGEGRHHKETSGPEGTGIAKFQGDLKKKPLRK